MRDNLTLSTRLPSNLMMCKYDIGTTYDQMMLFGVLGGSLQAFSSWGPSAGFPIGDVWVQAH
jgi:hypothetical protein